MKGTEWSKHVRRWRRSGLTGREFAARTGLNAGTLMYWASRLKREAEAPPRRTGSRKRSRIRLPLVELTANLRAEHFELEVGAGRWLRIPAGFDAPALERLLLVLDRSER